MPKTVTHPGTNRAQRRVTTLIETNALPLRQTVNQLELQFHIEYEVGTLVVGLLHLVQRGGAWATCITAHENATMPQFS